MSKQKIFTVRIPEQFIDFSFNWYEYDSINDSQTLAELEDASWDAATEQPFEYEVYDEHGFRVALNADRETPLEAPAPEVKGPGNA